MSDNPRGRRKSKPSDQDTFATGAKQNGTHKQTQQQHRQQGPQSSSTQSPQSQSTHQPSQSPQLNGKPNARRERQERERQERPYRPNQPANQPKPQPQTDSQQPLEHPEPRPLSHSTDSVEFNPIQIEQHLQQLWNLSLDQSRNSGIPAHERPVVYQDGAKAWGDGKNPVLSPFNFSLELKKAYIAKFGDSTSNSISSSPPKQTPSPPSQTSTSPPKQTSTSLKQTPADAGSSGTPTNQMSNVNNSPLPLHDDQEKGRPVQNTVNPAPTSPTRGNPPQSTSTNQSQSTKSQSQSQPTKPQPTPVQSTSASVASPPPSASQAKKSNKNKNKKNENKLAASGDVAKMNGKHEVEKEVNKTRANKQQETDTKKQEVDAKKQEPGKKQETIKKQEPQDDKPETAKKEEPVTNRAGEVEGRPESDTEEHETTGMNGKPYIIDQDSEETQHLLKEESEEEEIDEKGYNYGFTNDEYEEISDPVANPDQVVIDINDIGDENEGEPGITSSKPNGKSNKQASKKKGKKGKGKAKHPHDGETKNNKNTSNNNNNNNLSNNNGSIINLRDAANKEVWTDLLGTLLPRPKLEVVKISGTGTLKLDNSGNVKYSPESVQTANPTTNPPLLFNGIPREVVRVFANRFSKPNISTDAEFPGMLPVKWSSGEGVMATGRKFPIEVPFFLKDMVGSPKVSKTTCANLKCNNTTTEDKPFKTCAKCNSTAYCSRECQIEDWAKRHKTSCKTNAAAAEEQRKTLATQKIWSTSTIRQMIYLHWYQRYGKGVIVLMCKDFLSNYDDDPSTRELYMFYVPMLDLAGDDCPIPALKKCQAEFSKAFANHESDTYVIAAAAVDSTGFVTSQVDEVKSIQLKLHKRSCKEHDLQKVDVIAMDTHNQALLYTFN